MGPNYFINYQTKPFLLRLLKVLCVSPLADYNFQRGPSLCGGGRYRERETDGEGPPCKIPDMSSLGTRRPVERMSRRWRWRRRPLFLHQNDGVHGLVVRLPLGLIDTMKVKNILSIIIPK